MTDQIIAPAPHDAAPPSGAVTNGDLAGYRYPGSPPFADTEIDRLLFRGRTQEIDQVLHSILSVDLLLVYAVSGIGKTSLLTAGVLESLRQRGFLPVIIRLNDPASGAVKLIDDQIRESSSAIDGLTVTRHPMAPRSDDEAATLWDLLSGLEVWRGNDLQRLVLIFDQFEELFTLGWSDEQRDGFIAQLGHVVRRYRPATATTAEDVVLPPPDVKITIIMREDFLGELEALAEHIPQIMQHRFRLAGLTPEQAEAAIREPADVRDPRLASRRFAYSEDAAQAMLDFLRAGNERGQVVQMRSIDPSQLQIICQHIERAILPGKGEDPEENTVVEITAADLGGRAGLERILSEYYRREIMSFPAEQREQVRRLCETGLISEDARRLSLEEGQILTNFGVSKGTLDNLVQRRLLRAEPRVGSVYYELAHDTLTRPILDYRQQEAAAAQAGRARRRRRWIMALAAVALVVVAAAVVRALTSDSGPPVIALDEEIAGRLDRLGERDEYQVTTETAEPLVVTVTPVAPLDAFLEVTSPDQPSEVANLGTGGGLEQVVLVAPVAGEHRVIVSGTSSGEYRLAVRRTEVEELAFGGTVPVVVDDAGQQVVYRFNASVDTPVALELVAADAEFDGYLEVRYPTGVLGGADTGGRGEGERVLLASSSGWHRIAVGGSSAGRVELSVLPVEVSSISTAAPVRGSTTSDPVEDFVFEAEAEKSVLVAVTADEILDGSLEVTGPDGLTEAAVLQGAGGTTGEEGQDRATASLVVDRTVAGRYQVVVTTESPGAFEVSVQEVEVTEVPDDGRVSGAITTDRPVEVFEVETPGGEDVLAIQLKGESELVAELAVTTNGWTDSAYSFFGEPGTLVVGGPTAEDVRIVVGRYESTGSYELSVTPIEVVEMFVGQREKRRITSENPAGVFEFDVTGQPLTATVRPEDTLDVATTLYGTGGPTQRVDEALEGGVELIIAPNTGQRSRIVVTRPQSTAGDFEISLARTDVVDMDLGTSVPGAITPDSPVGVFQLNAPPETSYVVQVDPVAGLDAKLQLSGPYGDLDSSDRLPADGTETLDVIGGTDGSRPFVVVSGTESTGRYEVTIREPEAVQLVLGETVERQIGTSHAGGWFVYDAPTDAPVVIEVEPSPELDATVEVIDPNGSAVWSDSGLEGESELIELDGSLGRYVVLVRGYAESTGPYSLTIRPAG